MSVMCIVHCVCFRSRYIIYTCKGQIHSTLRVDILNMEVKSENGRAVPLNFCTLFLFGQPL